MQTSLVWTESKRFIDKQVSHCNTRIQHIEIYHPLIEHQIYDEPLYPLNMTGIYLQVLKGMEVIDTWVSRLLVVAGLC